MVKRRKRRARYPRMDDAKCRELFGKTFQELGKALGKHPADAWGTRSAGLPDYSVALVYRHTMGIDLGPKGQAEVDAIDARRAEEEEKQRRLEEAAEREFKAVQAFIAAEHEAEEESDPKGTHGGSREGSGRKPREKAPARHVHAVRLTDEEEELYSRYKGSQESWGDYLRRVLDANARVQERVQRMREQRERGVDSGKKDSE